MKKIISLMLVSVLCIIAMVSFTACNNSGTSAGVTQSPSGTETAATATPTPTPLPDDIDPTTVDVIGETWRVTELSFDSTKEYDSSTDYGAEQSAVIMDVIFTHKTSGTTLTIPSFWDNDNNFKVRFAPTEYGVWEYKTVCETDDSLNGKTGTIGANAYKGDLDIYKHGFVTIEDGNKYFTYADGTPFFYLGDTHWNLFTEEFDRAGTHAGDIQTNSHFKYIVDKRVEQGFTVYQSEPIGVPFTLSDQKISKSDIKGMQDVDRYFQYIADKGLVHANAQFFFSTTMTLKFAQNTEFLERISRMWVARWGAYPVMWTLGQEIDNDLYYENDNGLDYNYSNNPWVTVAEYMHKHDAYNHPLTAHQENTGMTTVTGAGANAANKSGVGMSAFFSKEVTERTGHNWWGAQWSPSLTGMPSAAVAKDYWNSPKVSVNYEGRYCYLWTKNYGARAQGWISYLNGFFGYGYGAIDIWLYQSTYNTDVPSNDGIDTITVEDKLVHWGESINFESAYQVGYMHHFFSFINWWELKPDFADKVYFNPDESVNYSCATKGNELYVVYLCNKDSSKTGVIANMDGDATYRAMWFNPRTCEYITIGADVKANTTDINGKPGYKLPEKPNNDNLDWVLLFIKNA